MIQFRPRFLLAINLHLKLAIAPSPAYLAYLSTIKGATFKTLICSPPSIQGFTFFFQFLSHLFPPLFGPLHFSCSQLTYLLRLSKLGAFTCYMVVICSDDASTRTQTNVYQRFGKSCQVHFQYNRYKVRLQARHFLQSFRKGNGCTYEILKSILRSPFINVVLKSDTPTSTMKWWALGFQSVHHTALYIIYIYSICDIQVSNSLYAGLDGKVIKHVCKIYICLSKL